MNKWKLFSSRRKQIVLYAGHTNSTVIVESLKKWNQIWVSRPAHELKSLNILGIFKFMNLRFTEFKHLRT